MTRKLLNLVPLAFLGLALVLRILDPVPVQQIRTLVFDTYQRLKPRAYDPNFPVRIIDIDEESLARHGQWPWPRPVLAELINRLTAAGAAAIAFDVVFAEVDRSSPEEALKYWPKTLEVLALRDTIAPLPSHDKVFGAAIANSRIVTGFVLRHGEAKSRAPARKATFAIAGDDPKPFVPAFTTAVVNLEPIEAPAMGNGAFNSLPDRDNIIRRMPLVFRLGEQLYPSLAAEALRIAQDARTYVIKSSGASGVVSFGESTGVNSVRVGQFIVPTDSRGRLVMRYTGSQRARYIPAFEVLSDSFDPERVAGQILFVGTSAAGLLDIRSTPLERIIPGVEINVQAVEQMITGDFLLRPDYAKGSELVYMLALGLIVILLMAKTGAIISLVVGGTATASVVGGSWYAFDAQGWLFDPVYPSIMVFLVFAAGTVISYLRSELEKRQVRNAFSLYLAPEMVERVASDPSRLRLGGEQRNMTILFSDIRGFTSISEHFKDDPEGLTTLINRLLTPLTEVVMANQGTIDKYIGDALMAFWNAPLDDPDHARNACASALKMFDAMESLNRELAREASGETNPPETAKDYREAKQLALGAGVRKDPRAAFKILKREAESGFPNAQYSLAKAYRDGVGTDANLEQAIRWFRAAAEQGYAKAQRNLGTRYARGDGVPQDSVSALTWLTLAARQGLAAADAQRQDLIEQVDAEAVAEAERRTNAFKAKVATQRAIRLEMGVGIGTGNCLVGNLGSKQRFDYSVLGDSVNLASRLEGQTKNYGVSAIISEETRLRADGFATLELDLIAVKGKREASRIFGLLGDEELAGDPDFKALVERHGEMLKAYRGQCWDAAAAIIDECAERDSGLEYLYEIYRNRIHQYRLQPPGANWDGVFVATTK